MSYQTERQPAERLGRYELLGLLATGGMAEIHLARLAGEAGFEKIVVVKRLLPELVASHAYVEMFLGEAKLVAKLSHPNVCEVYELGREGAEYFLVMPFLDGVPATELIARPRDPDRAAQLRVAAGVIAQACAGLHHAHELRGDAGPGRQGALVGLVHRDVSPSNLFVTADGVVKVLDFGIAKTAGTAETEAGTVKGKAQYMAPEQLLGEQLDRRADVFALGIVLYELATHQRLFKRASDYLAARAILEEPIPRADAADPALPVALADVIARALARRPGDRFTDAPALAAALDAAFAPSGRVATPAQIAAALAEQHAAELTAQRTRQARVVDRARDAVGNLGVGNLGVGVGVGGVAGGVGGVAGGVGGVAGGVGGVAGGVGGVDRPRDVAGANATAGTSSTGSATPNLATGVSTEPATDMATRVVVSARRRRIARRLALGVAAAAAIGIVVAGAIAFHDGGTADREVANAAPKVRSPDSNVRSPDSNVRSPDSNVRSPDPDVRSPDSDVRSPDSNVRSPDPNVRSPAPDVRSPAPNADATTRGSASPTATVRTAPVVTATAGDVAAPTHGSGHANGSKSIAAVRPSHPPGWFSIDSSPFAQIFVDDHLFGVTPLVHKSMASGRHHVRAVLEDGRAKDLEVVVTAGKLAAPITLSW